MHLPPAHALKILGRRGCQTIQFGGVSSFRNKMVSWPRPDWFRNIFGFEEIEEGGAEQFPLVRSKLSISKRDSGAYILTTENGKQLWVGCYTQQSLGDLLEQVKASARALQYQCRIRPSLLTIAPPPPPSGCPRCCRHLRGRARRCNPVPPRSLPRRLPFSGEQPALKILGNAAVNR